MCDMYDMYAGMSVNYELERSWEDVVRTYFKVLSQHLHGGTEEKYEKPDENTCHSTEIRTMKLPTTE
jgi:hypothetical protein